MPLEQLQDTNSLLAIAPHLSSSYPDYLSPVWDEDTQRAVVWHRLREHRKLASHSLRKINERYKALRQEQQTQVESRHESSSRDNIPCKESITTEGVAALILRHVFTRFGAPKKFISDRNSRFTSKVAKEYCKKFKTQQNMSTAYHPRTDGQAERTNQEAEIYLCMYCNK